MAEASSNTAPSQIEPSNGSSPQQDAKDVPELEAFDEDEFEVAFAQLEQPKQS